MKDSAMRALERSRDPEALEALAREGMRQGLDFAEVFPSYDFDDDDGDERSTCSSLPRIRIDGELYHITNSREIGWGDLWEIETEEGEDFILSEDCETAGDAAAERWRDMAQNDPQEFACMVGEQTLIAWALNQPAGPGSNKDSRNLEEWLALVASVPEEEWASYDGSPRTVGRVGKLASELGYCPSVAYRCN